MSTTRWITTSNRYIDGDEAPDERVHVRLTAKTDAGPALAIRRSNVLPELSPKRELVVQSMQRGLCMGSPDNRVVGVIARHAQAERKHHSPDESGQLGEFRFYFDDGRWEWSAQTAILHGYRPGTVAPGISLVLSHVHPCDYRHVAATLDAARRTHQPFASRQRIIDTGSRVHNVMMVGVPLTDARGATVGMHGVFIDLTSAAPWANYPETAERLRVAAANGVSAERSEWIRFSTEC